MTLAYPLLHVLIYLSLLFAPADTRRITITGPDQNVEIIRTDAGWTATAQDGKPAAVSVSDGVLQLQPEGDASQSIPLAAFVSAAVGHDWNQTPKVTLQETTTLEKTAKGFVLRVKSDGTEIHAYLITFHSDPAAPGGPALSINVIGAVKQPGRYTLPAGATLLDAVAAAGGANRLADRTRMVITRGPAGEKPTTLTYNGEKIASKKLKGPELKDGDTIHIPEWVF